jgi:hypothetical protein
MAIAFVNLGASTTPDTTSATDATSYATASWTPPTTGIILLAFIAARSGGSADAASVTGNSLTWTQIGSNVNATSGHKLCLFAALAAGATTGATTVDWGANSQNGTTMVFCQVTGVDTTGGLAAVFVQSPSNTGSGTTGTVTLSAAANSNNRPFAAFYHGTNESKTFRTNWTELDDLGGTGPTRNLETQCRSDAFETTASATWTTSGVWSGIAVELKNLGGTLYVEDHEGTVTPAGALVRRTNKIEAGTVTPAGSIAKRTSKAQAGTLTPAGALAAIKIITNIIAGTLTPAGTLVRRTSKVLAGSLTSTGALVKQTNKLWAGTITPAGALVKRTLKALAGALTTAGAHVGEITTVVPDAVAAVAMTLYPRTISYTLAAGRNAFTLAKRVISFTLQEK